MIEKTNNYAPAVSIGMPVYNGGKYIREALDSLLAQTFENFELIISDNCSTDGTSHICKEYTSRDSRVRYIRQDTNIGALANFQFVLEKSKAEYFMWAAYDDKWSSNWVEVLLQKLSGSIAGAAFGRVVPVDVNLKPYIHIANSQKFYFDSFRYWRKVKFYLDYEGRGKANLFYSLFKRDWIKQVNLLNNTNDYSIIYDSMSKFGYLSVKSTFLFKRNHTDNEGNIFSSQTPLIKKIMNNILPLPLKLFCEYLKSSNFIEKSLVISLLPVKFCVAYYWLTISYFLKRGLLTKKTSKSQI